jgi:uncharacterized protein YndB with AHSA1/START domain
MPGENRSSAESGLMTNKIDYCVRLEIELNHSVESVWPYLLHWNRWVNETEYREYRVAGEPDSEGEIKQIIHFDETGRLEFSFHAEIVKVIPNQKLVYKLLAPMSIFDGASAARSELVYTGYEVFELRERRGQVHFTFDLYAEEVRDVAIPKDEARRLAADFVVATEKRWYERYFPRLRALLDK